MQMWMQFNLLTRPRKHYVNRRVMLIICVSTDVPPLRRRIASTQRAVRKKLLIRFNNGVLHADVRA